MNDGDELREARRGNDPRGQAMKTPEDVAEMLRLTACGWGVKRIAAGAGLQPSHGEGSTWRRAA